MLPQSVDFYHIAENDKNQLLVSIPDQKVTVEDAFYTLEGDDLILHYPDKRQLLLSTIPPHFLLAMRHCKEILVVESTNEALTRAYDVKNSALVPLKRRRTKL